MLETKPLELIYHGPTNISQVLLPYSASPLKVLLSGFRSRCHIVIKGAFPDHRVQQGLDQLIHLYTLAGFPNEELQNHFITDFDSASEPSAARKSASHHSRDFVEWLLFSGFVVSMFSLVYYLGSE